MKAIKSLLALLVLSVNVFGDATFVHKNGGECTIKLIDKGGNIDKDDAWINGDFLEYSVYLTCTHNEALRKLKAIGFSAVSRKYTSNPFAACQIEIPLEELNYMEIGNRIKTRIYGK